MPGREPLSSIANIDALITEKERIINEVIRPLQEAIDGVGKSASLFKNAKGASDQKAATDGLIQSNERLLQVQKLLDEEKQKSTNLERTLAKEAAIMSELRKQSKIEIQDEAKATLALEGSLQKLRIELKQAQRAYDEMSAAQRNSAKGTELLTSIQAQDKALKELEGSTGRHQRKVGDYIGAVSILGKALNEVKIKLDQFTQAGQGNSEEAAQLKNEYEALSALVNQQAKGFTSLTMELRANERALVTMRAAGLEGTEAFEELQGAVVKATREMNEFRKEQKLLESAAPNLAAMTTVAKGIGGAYAFGAGAAALFAEGNEKVEKELNKLVAIMTILQGLNELHELAEKKGAIAKLFNAAATRVKNFVMTGSVQVTRENISATLTNAAAQNVETVAVDNTSKAMVRLRFALMATGIGAILLLLPLFVSGMSEVTEETKEAAESAEDLEERLKEEKEVIEGVSGQYQAAVKNVTELKINVELAKQGFLDKKKVVDEYNETMGKTTGLVKDLDDVEKKLEADAAAYIQFTLLKAAANIALGKAAEKAFTAEIEGRKKVTEYKKVLADTRVGGGGSGGLGTGAFNAAEFEADEKRVKEAQQKRKDEAVKAITDQQKEMQEIAEKFQKEAAEIAKKMGFNFFGDNAKKEETKADFTDYEEGFRQLREEFAKFHREAFNVDVDPYIKELQTIQEKYQEMYIKTNDVRDKDLAKIAENEKKKIITLQQANKLRLKIDQDTNMAREAAEAGYYANLNALQEKHRKEVEEKRKEQAKKDFQDALNDQKKMAKALGDEADAHFREQVTIAKNNQKAAPTFQNDKALAAAERDEQIRQQTKLLEEKKITQKEFDSDMLAIQADYDKKIGESFAKQFSRYADEAKVAFDLVGNLEKAAEERKIQSIDRQIAATQKMYDKQRQNIEGSTLNEQQKAAQLNVLAQQQRTKEEQLQKQKQAEQIKQAKFEKAASVVNIAIATSEAVAKILLEAAILSSNPLTAALAPQAYVQAGIAAAVGAAQLAAVIAKPIPTFARGTSNAPAGLAIWGEAGQEAKIDRYGNVEISPNRATPVHLQGGEQIIPHDKLNEWMYNNMLQATATMIMPTRQDESAKEIRRLQRIVQDQGDRADRAAKNQKAPRVTIKINPGWDAYIRKSVKE